MTSFGGKEVFLCFSETCWTKRARSGSPSSSAPRSTRSARYCFGYPSSTSPSGSSCLSPSAAKGAKNSCAWAASSPSSIRRRCAWYSSSSPLLKTASSPSSSIPSWCSSPWWRQAGWSCSSTAVKRRSSPSAARRARRSSPPSCAWASTTQTAAPSKTTG